MSMIFNTILGGGLQHIADGKIKMREESGISTEYIDFDKAIPGAKSDDFIFITKISQDEMTQVSKIWQSGNHLKGIIHYNRGSNPSIGEGYIYYSIYRGVAN